MFYWWRKLEYPEKTNYKLYHSIPRPLKSVNTWNLSPFWNELSREFRCWWRHLACKLRPEIDNQFTFTLIKTTMRFKQVSKEIFRFWCQNGAILLPFWLNNQSNISRITQFVVDNFNIHMFVYIPLHILTYIYNSIRQRQLYCFHFEIK